MLIRLFKLYNISWKAVNCGHVLVCSYQQEALFLRTTRPAILEGLYEDHNN